MEFFEHSSADQNITLKRIRDSLWNRIKECHTNLDDDGVACIVHKILKVNGLDAERFDFVKQFKKFTSERLNDLSIDDNSNKNEKTIASLYNEVQAPIKKVTGFDYLYCTMRELYGKQEATRLSGLMYDYSLGLSDSTNILIPYCYALDGSRIVTEGRDFGVLPSKPAKRVSSYVSALCETIHQISTHLAGAVAIGTFFFDIARLLLQNYENPIQELDKPEYRKNIENEFQQFVHSVNHLSRSASESPFTNISIFDSVKIRYLVTHDLAWYYESYDTDTVVDLVYKLQNIFLDFFDKGDPLNSGLPYRFPVVTINIAKERDEVEKWVIRDQDFLDNTVKRDIYRYNIFTSEGTKTASCCRLINDGEMLELASQSNSFGAGAVGNLGSHRVCTINFNRIALEANSYQEYFALFHKRMEDTRKILKAHKILIKKQADGKLQMFIQNGWIALGRLFSTYGVMGLYEAEKTMKVKFPNGYQGDFIGDVLKELNDYIIQATHEDDGYIYNIEQIPGESYAARLCTVDKILYGEDAVPFHLYANQWIPLWEEASIWEKLDADGKYNSMLTGGGIVHATIGETVNSYQAKEIIKYAVKCGCEHFALNAIYSKCKNGHMSMGDYQTCPECSQKIVDKMTRIVGFFTPVSSWSTPRKWDFEHRTKVQF